MRTLSLEEQIGQLILVGFNGLEGSPGSLIIRQIRDYHLGGVWLTDREGPVAGHTGNIESPDQVRRLTVSLQANAAIPLFVAIDAEGGQIIRLKPEYGFTVTIPAAELGKRNLPALTFDQARSISQMLQSLGINFNFAPVLDLNTFPDNPAIGRKQRSFSEDPFIVIKHALQVLYAQRQAGIMSAIKHFPGQGGARTDSHTGLVDVTGYWTSRDLEPFKHCIDAGLTDAVLSAHIYLRQFDAANPATFSPVIINGLLRHDMGYDGLIISDDLLMGAIRRFYSFEATVFATLSAGIDVLLIAQAAYEGEDYVQLTHAIIMDLIRQGRLTPDRISRSFNRVMALKQKYLMFK